MKLKKKELLQNFKKFELILIIVALLALPLLFLKPFSLTSFQSLDVSTQKLDLLIENSTEILLKLNSGEGERLTSLAISGEVIGDGYAAVYLTNGKTKLLVWHNLINLQNEITGYSIAKSQSQFNKTIEISLGEQIKEQISIPSEGPFYSGQFSDACVQTCTLDPKWDGKEWKLLVYLTPGTKLKLDRIIFVFE